MQLMAVSFPVFVFRAYGGVGFNACFSFLFFLALALALSLSLSLSWGVSRTRSDRHFLVCLCARLLVYCLSSTSLLVYFSTRLLVSVSALSLKTPERHPARLHTLPHAQIPPRQLQNLQPIRLRRPLPRRPLPSPKTRTQLQRQRQRQRQPCHLLTQNRRCPRWALPGSVLVWECGSKG